MIRVPISVDTRAEVSVLSNEFLQRLFPEQDIPTGIRQVRALGGQLFTLKGPLKLKVVVSEHAFYYYDKNPTFLMGFDLISAAALVIDPVNRCVWSKITASTPSAPQQSTQFNVSVPPFPSLQPAAEDFDSDDSDRDASPPRSPPSPPPPSPVSPSADPLLHSGVVRRHSLSASSTGNCHCVPARSTATHYSQPQLHSPLHTPVSVVRRQQLLASSTHKHQSSLITLHNHSLQPLTVTLSALHHRLSSSTTAHFRPRHQLLIIHQTIRRLLSKRRLMLRLTCLSMLIYCSCKQQNRIARAVTLLTD